MVWHNPSVAAWLYISTSAATDAWVPLHFQLPPTKGLRVVMSVDGGSLVSEGGVGLSSLL